jgi:transcription initiation factor TFIIB
MASSEPWDAYESLRIPLICEDCQEDPPNLDNDLSTGDVVCASCGRVVADHLLDETAEWRNFSNDNDGPAEDKSRVGQAASSLLYGAQLQTSISFGGGASLGGLTRAHQDASLEKANAYLLSVYAQIDTLCSSISVTRAVSDYAKQAYKGALDKGFWKPTAKTKTLKSQQTQLAQIATCLMVACRAEGVSRSMKEITQLVGLERKQFTKVFKDYHKGVSKHHFEESTEESDTQGSGTISTTSSMHVEPLIQPLVSITNVETTRVEELIPRFASRLKPPLPFSILRKAQDYALEINNCGLVTGRQPTSIAGVCLLFATKDLIDAPSRKEIADVVGISEGTIRTVSKLLEPHFEREAGDRGIK